ncbi:hypothetical protein A3A18_00935 [Candidatus Azambacteria bacterium RIFCSPLOWO2_01_FULL_44_84]|uniref:GH15-like domain-containing protein n=1 Tax=Candidatus Azambacteria bacterium RIFCSPLOWO2_02_FULL_44_14 TaxID=1797306 RepID=A0A1F5CAF9_9BACT|nr:MAG: hypothetical protein A3A18_00935 [Candidatus Azambacteria bacterium RIFCSPLOWO2_01_FULL_44_84]OGD39856.1 MAG: hypothetical protein A3I30_00410 [Candidatus Azambacteria bacterium RIFCSPLOWO2_02_FULL_44_14]
MRAVLLREMENLQKPSGAFIAAPSGDYRSCWLRDHLYCVFTYFYLNDFEKLQRGIWVVFDILHKYRWKIEKAIITPPGSHNVHEFIHAKYDPDTFNEITNDWGHHQLDALGLLLHIVADLDFKNIRVIRNENDSKLIQLLIFYLLAVKFWKNPDNGMWEEGLDFHSSSVGAIVAGLSYINRRQIVVVPSSMINAGCDALNAILPNESSSREIDMASLSLIWPYNIVSREIADTILSRAKSKLAQRHGLNRYWGDNYFRSRSGVSGEWPMGFFWLSIIYSQRHEAEEARHWFDRGLAEIVFGIHIPELYKDGESNNHTPLAWAHALAVIAEVKLEQEINKPH